MPPSGSTVGRSVTSKALAVLGCFDVAHPRRTLTDIATATGLPLSTTHRLIAELISWEGLTRGADGRYEIGRRIWNLGALAAVSRELRQTALPVMHDLSAAPGENVHIAVLEDMTALYVDRISGARAVPIVSRPAARLPLHTTGVGKVLLAHADPDLQRRYLANLFRVTPYTVVEPKRLAQQLSEVRTRGYATTAEEMTMGACSIAAPIHGAGGEVVAALGIVTSSSHRQLGRLAPAVQIAAAAISRGLRVTPWQEPS